MTAIEFLKRSFVYCLRAPFFRGLFLLALGAASAGHLPALNSSLWMGALGATAFGGILYARYRFRVTQVLALDRVRMRIATDLHDDIGSNLSRIAMLSEVLRQGLAGSDAEIVERLAHIADISRESVEALSDIVWAVNPDKDRLSDLTQRMRRVADDFCCARGIDFAFRADFCGQDVKLGADTRREVLLIFKECVNNIARHSGCAAVAVEFRIEGGWLILKICDDGCGMNSACANHGNGLGNMRQRAARLGGRFEVASGTGAGTAVRLAVPAHQVHQAHQASY